MSFTFELSFKRCQLLNHVCKVSLIGAIHHKGKIIQPRGDQQIHAHDRVIMFALAKQVRKVEQMFRVSLESFELRFN